MAINRAGARRAGAAWRRAGAQRSGLRLVSQGPGSAVSCDSLASSTRRRADPAGRRHPTSRTSCCTGPGTREWFFAGCEPSTRSMVDRYRPCTATALAEGSLRTDRGPGPRAADKHGIGRPDATPRTGTGPPALQAPDTHRPSGQATPHGGRENRLHQPRSTAEVSESRKDAAPLGPPEQLTLHLAPLVPHTDVTPQRRWVGSIKVVHPYLAS